MKFGVAPACAELLVYCSQTTLLFGVGIGALMPLLAMETFGQAHFGAIFGALTVGQIVPSLAGPLALGVLFDSSGHYLGAFGMVRVHRRLQTIRSHADLDGLFAALEHRRLCRGRLRTGADRRSPGQAAALEHCARRRAVIDFHGILTLARWRFQSQVAVNIQKLASRVIQRLCSQLPRREFANTGLTLQSNTGTHRNEEVEHPVLEATTYPCLAAPKSVNAHMRGAETPVKRPRITVHGPFLH